MNEMTIKFNGQNYIANYNKETGYYEIDLAAPDQGGIYNTEIKFTDLFEQNYEATKAVQVLAKEKLKLETTKVFMWIFNGQDFKVKDILEIADYEINIDEETNAKSSVKILKETTAKADDIVAIKKNNEIIYWGIIDEIQNEDGKKLYEYTLKYITNLFSQKVALSKNQTTDEITEGYYRIRTILNTNKVLDVVNGSKETGANVQLYENNNSDAQKWKVTKSSDGYHTFMALCSGKMLDLADGIVQNEQNVWQVTYNGSDAQKWRIEHDGGSKYRIRIKGHFFYIDVKAGKAENGTNIQLYSGENKSINQQFILEKLEDITIREEGIEDFIANAIKENFTNSDDEFMNKKYIEVRVKTHTKLSTTVSNVENNLYNLHTYMTNCTQLYNINYNIYAENGKLIIEIENKSAKKKLIDINAQAITKYTEVFETDIISKVEVLTDTDIYYLYLLTDRTTTTDKSNANRAKGRTEVVYVKDIQEAEQKALDTIKTNRYNHNITFEMAGELMKTGTPIAIKTKNSTIFDTYISATKIKNNSKFVEYTCGNIRIKFIDKLLKERNK